MKRGDKVAVCYDGKLGRHCVGEIIATKYGRIQVRFFAWGCDSETIITHWFHSRKRPRRWGGAGKHYSGFVPVPDGSMQAIIGTPGDWYDVYKWKKFVRYYGTDA